MTLLDFTIIYLACGSPFAVYRAYARGGPAWKLVLVALAWPYFAFQFGLKVGDKAALNERSLIDLIRIRFEEKVLDSGESEAVFNFREVFETYTGLATASLNSGSPAASTLLEVASHPSRSLAEACLVRMQDAKLTRHLASARFEFASLLANKRSPALDELVLQLAGVLDDPALALEVSHVAPARSIPSTAAVHVG